MGYLRARVSAGARTKRDLIQARRRFLALLSSRDADAAVREMRAHLRSVHRLLTVDGGEAAAPVGAESSGSRTGPRRRDRAVA